MSERGQPSDISVGPFYVREGSHLVIDVAQAPSAQEVEDLKVRFAYEQGRLAERAVLEAIGWFPSASRPGRPAPVRVRGAPVFHRSAWLGWLILLSFIAWACFIGWLLQAVLTR